MYIHTCIHGLSINSYVGVYIRRYNILHTFSLNMGGVESSCLQGGHISWVEIHVCLIIIHSTVALSGFHLEKCSWGGSVY